RDNRAVRFPPGGRLLVATLSAPQPARIDGPKTLPRKLVVRDMTAGTTVGSFVAFEDIMGNQFTLAGVAFSPDGRRLAGSVVASGARSLARSSNEEPSPEQLKKWEEEGAAALAAFRPFTAVWDIGSGKTIRQVPTGGMRQRAVAFDRSGSRVAVGDGRRVVVFDPDSASPPAVREHHSGSVLAVAFGPDATLWTGAEDRRVCGLAAGAVDLRDDLRGCPHPVVRLAVSPDGSEVVAVTYDLIGATGRLHRFEVKGGGTWRFAGGARIRLVVAVSPHANRVAPIDGSFGAKDGIRFLIRDPLTGAEWRAEKADPWLSGAFLPDGGMVVAARNGLLVLDSEARPVRDLPLPDKGTAH